MNTVVLSSNTSWYLYNFRSSTIRALVNKGYNVTCLSPVDEYSPLLENELGVKHIHLDLDGKNTTVWRELKSIWALFGTIRQIRPFHVFNFTAKLNIYGGLACRILGVPYSNNVSGLGTLFIHDSLLYRLIRKLYVRVNRSARTVFFQNPEDLSLFNDVYSLHTGSIVLLPGSGVDLRRFGFQQLPDSKPFTFLMISRLLGDKGVREYVTATRLLLEEGHEIRCILLGQLGASNRSAISRKELNEWLEAGLIDYLGEVRDVRHYISLAHVMVLPSYREGMPRTVLEGAAMGRPAIVSDVAGCRHAIEPGITGWLCEARNPVSLASSMREVIALPKEILQSAGVAARQRMEKSFDEEIVISAYIECLGQGP